VIDTARQNLYVACTGDSRAVAGIWEESPDGKGTWRVEVLSEDQTGNNENEVARYDPLSLNDGQRAEHVFLLG
jgi:pyruvate dehydrogenase phosphatase